ncbi:MAG: hypothetical protein GYA35_05035 [Thermoanaerobaculaceae bacterium]|nr:hypothetical protein [Thermoanaerobaculaceae bacterium]
MAEKEKVVDEIIKKYSHRMPFPDRAGSLMRLYLQRGKLPESDFNILALSLLASISEPLFLHIYSKEDLIDDFFLLTRNKENLSFNKIKDSLQRKIFSSSKEVQNVINDFRLVHLSAVVVLDLLSILSFEEVCLALSDIADAVVSTAIYLSEHKAMNQMGMPYHKVSGDKLVKTKFVFFALGKWGAQELNYSSDIDLITFYEEDGKTDKGFLNSDYFEKIARNVYEILTSEPLSLAGFKVDFDLRPRGKDGRLTIPIKNAFDYYSKEAQFWEKQAWIKARTFYGDSHLGEEFISKMHKLIISANNSAFFCKEIIKSRQKTLQNITDKKRDLKEGDGSIRDIEFAVQALSIASAKIEKNTLKAIHLLKESNNLTSDEEEKTRKSYEILRKSEHFVQVVNLRQVHLEPKSEKEWEGLKKFLSSEEPKKLIEESRKRARIFFQRKLELLLKSDGEKIIEIEIAEDLKKRNFEKIEAISPILHKIYNILLSSNEVEVEDVRKFHKIILSADLNPKFFQKALKSLETILSNEASFKRIMAKKSNFPEKLERIFKIVSLSESASEYLKTIPESVETLLREDFTKIDTEDFSFGLKNLEIREIALKQKKIFIASIAKQIFEKDKNFCEVYSKVAEDIVRSIFEKTAKEFSDSKISQDISSKIAIFSLGRLGFREMVFGSDLDLLIVKKDDKDSSNLFSDSVENRVARAVIENLSSMTSCGNLYEVDLRLRPFGSSGVLVPSVETIKKYFKKEARLWEKLSYTKIRFLCGNSALAKKVYSSVLQSFYKEDSSSLSAVKILIRRLLKSNQTLEGEIKFKEGGLFDQDLFVAALINNSGKLCFGKGFAGALFFLKEEKILTEEETSLLKEAKDFFLKLLYGVRIYSSPHKKPKTIEELSLNFWKKEDEEKMRKEIVSLINSRFPRLL